jgi:hypothetical protein
MVPPIRPFNNKAMLGEVSIMERIEAVIRHSELKRFFQCAERLGIFGFDLSETRKSSEKIVGGENRHQSRLTVDFAVFDAETRDTVHAVLEEAHPDSIAIFKLAPEST